jgi:hypothetical protein
MPEAPTLTCRVDHGLVPLDHPVRDVLRLDIQSPGEITHKNHLLGRVGMSSRKKPPEQ